MKKIFVLLTAAAMAFAAFGCNSAPSAEGGITGEDGQEITLFDDAPAVASIGGQEIPFSEYRELFNNYAYYYTAIGHDLSDAAELKDFQDLITDLLIEDKIVAYRAAEGGYDKLSDEKRADAEKQAAEELQAIAENLHQQAESAAADNPSIDVQERFEELMANESESYTGKRMTKDELGKWILDTYMKNAAKEAFREAAVSDVTVSDQEIQDWYDENTAAAKETYTDNPEFYKDDKEAEELYGGTPVLYAPAGYSRILHILIVPDEPISGDYDAKMASIEELKREYGRLAFETEVEGGDGGGRMKEITAEYQTLKAETDKLYRDYMAPALKKAQEATAKLKAGEDFSAVAAAYSDDDEVPEKGRLISNDYSGEIDWSNKVKSAFVTLKIGEYSDVIEDDEGCHIILYLADEPEGVADISGVKEAIRVQLLEEAREAEWNKLMETWKNDGSVVLNEDLIRSVTYEG